LSTGRTATNSVTIPIMAQQSSVSTKPMAIGRPSFSVNIEPNTPPSIASWPAVKLITREVENIVL
jgi:hypothetical protein